AADGELPMQRVNRERAHALLSRFATTEQTLAAFEALRTYWTDLLSTYSVTSSDERLDRMVNIWNQYQCMVTFNMSRSASYFETGIGRGMGFRDSNQDLLGFVHLIPERARERIIDIASTQFPDGSAYHQYQPLTKRGNNDIGSGFNDDPLWLILGVAAYIKETGDWSILDEAVPFDNAPGSEVPLFEHLTPLVPVHGAEPLARTACRSSAAPTGTTASTSTASPPSPASRSSDREPGR
ncbi:hypothetical protein JS562_52815, partial [Agrobacterium sp. S2]|nr:hypothetical protein [Agrobacterium sp. S2]